MAARRVFGVCASSLSRFSVITFLGCALTLLCGSFFLRWFSSCLCFVNYAVAPFPRSLQKERVFASRRVLLRSLQHFAFGFSEYPISRSPDHPMIAAIPRPSAPSLCCPRPCDCSAIHRNLYPPQSHSDCA